MALGASHLETANMNVLLEHTCSASLAITARHIDVALDSKPPPGDELDLKFRAVKG
jgi:hypothetical protein